jgi:hypothetical protein
MLALRNLACNERWAEGWPQIEQQLRAQVMEKRKQQHPLPPTPAPQASLRRPAAPPPPPAQPQATAIKAVEIVPKPVKRTARPAADHPWRNFHFGRGYLKKVGKEGRAKS